VYALEPDDSKSASKSGEVDGRPEYIHPPDSPPLGRLLIQLSSLGSLFSDQISGSPQPNNLISPSLLCALDNSILWPFIVSWPTTRSRVAKLYSIIGRFDQTPPQSFASPLQSRRGCLSINQNRLACSPSISSSRLKQDVPPGSELFPICLPKTASVFRLPTTGPVDLDFVLVTRSPFCIYCRTASVRPSTDI
jgi:hypothetical protein